MTAAQTIAGFATSLTLDDVPADVVEHAKLHVLDTLGCGLAAHATGTAAEGRLTMAELGGEPQARLRFAKSLSLVTATVSVPP